MSFLLLQGTKGPFLVLLSHTFRYCCYAFIGFNKFCLDGHNMLMPFSLTHAEHPSSFSRPMSLCMVTITCMYIHVQSCTFCTCTPAYVTVGLLGVWARGGGGASRSDLAGPTKMGLLRACEVYFILHNSKRVGTYEFRGWPTPGKKKRKKKECLAPMNAGDGPRLVKRKRKKKS